MPEPAYVYRAVRTMGGTNIVQRRRLDWFAWELHEAEFSTINAAEARADELNEAAQPARGAHV